MTRPAPIVVLAAAMLTPTLCPVAAGQDAPTGEAAADKSRYWFGNPTPRELYRPLSADRPDATESPYTVDAGAVQIETSFAEYATRDGAEAWSVAPTNLKLGLTNDVDIQLGLTPYLREDRDGGGAGAADGFGDIEVRLKINLWGNDDGRLAIGILPFMTFPAGDDEVSAGGVEGGFIVPAALDLGGGWGLGGQIEFEFVREGSGEGYETVFAHTIAVSREVWGPVAAYAEWIGETTLDSADDYSPAIGLGATYALSADAQLDAGMIIGLDRPETEDVRLFAGFTWRY